MRGAFHWLLFLVKSWTVSKPTGLGRPDGPIAAPRDRHVRAESALDRPGSPAALVALVALVAFAIISLDLCVEYRWIARMRIRRRCVARAFTSTQHLSL